MDGEACGGRNRWRWCSERAVRGRGRRLGDGDPQLPGSIPRAETKRRLRRSSRRRGLRWLQSPATRRGAAAAMAAESMARVRVCRGGEAGEREGRSAVRPSPLSPRGGQVEGRGTAWRRHGASDATGATVRRETMVEDDRGPTRQVYFPFLNFFNSSNFRHLIEALKQF